MNLILSYNIISIVPFLLFFNLGYWYSSLYCTRSLGVVNAQLTVASTLQRIISLFFQHRYFSTQRACSSCRLIFGFEMNPTTAPALDWQPLGFSIGSDLCTVFTLSFVCTYARNVAAVMKHRLLFFALLNTIGVWSDGFTFGRCYCCAFFFQTCALTKQANLCWLFLFPPMISW